MRKLLRKELREQFKIAVLGLAILAVMLVLAFISSTEAIERVAFTTGYAESRSLQPLLADSLLAQVSFFCALFGVLLGWLQIQSEKHPDLWAFLVHRPIDRTAILRGKVLAGLLLYGLGAGLPLLAFVLVVRIPGKIAAPFAWAMALPLAAIFLVGIVYYFAGLLTGLRRARWYGSRGFGLGLAIPASAAVFAMPEFWLALLVIVITGTILAVAVWGSFQTGGYYRRQSVFGKMALTLVCTVSTLVVIGAVCDQASGLLFSRRHTYSYYQLARNGNVYKLTQHGFGESEIVDLDGKPLLDEKTGQKIKPADFSRYAAPGLSASVNFGDESRRGNSRRESYVNPGRFFGAWRVLDKTLWYLMRDGRLVGYHGITRRVVGTLAAQETSATGSSSEARLMRPNDHSVNHFQPYVVPEVLASARTAYLVDLEKRELKPFFTATNGDAIGGVSQNAAVFASSLTDVLILTRTSIRLLSVAGQTRLHLPYEPAPPAYPSISVFFLMPTGTCAVRFDPDYRLSQDAGGKLLTHVKWINPDQSLRNAIDLPKLPQRQQNLFSERLALLLLPPAIGLLPLEGSYRAWNLLSIIPAVLCAALGWWLARRNNFSAGATVGWAIFLLLLGVPGLLAFLAVQEWPAKETCPNCKKRRVVDRQTCEHCGAGFPSPEKTGTEIFEPLAAA